MTGSQPAGTQSADARCPYINVHTNALIRCALTHQSDIRLIQTSSDMNTYILELVKVQILIYVSLKPDLKLVYTVNQIGIRQPL